MAATNTILLFWFLLFCSILSLGNPLAETNATLDVKHILTREEEQGPSDIFDYSDSRLSPDNILFLAIADEPRVPGDLISMTGAGTDPFTLGFGAADDIDKSPDLFENPIIPSDLKPGVALAFHDGDLPEDGWGDCDFPKMPACCEYTILGVTCIWYTFFGEMCPDHPADIWPPRTEAEQARNRAVCCDRIFNQIGIGCVPVRDRFEPSVEEEDMAGELDDFFPILTDLNAIKFAPVPGACTAPHRRDSQTPAQCLPPKQ